MRSARAIARSNSAPKAPARVVQLRRRSRAPAKLPYSKAVAEAWTRERALHVASQRGASQRVFWSKESFGSIRPEAQNLEGPSNRPCQGASRTVHYRRQVGPHSSGIQPLHSKGRYAPAGGAAKYALEARLVDTLDDGPTFAKNDFLARISAPARALKTRNVDAVTAASEWKVAYEGRETTVRVAELQPRCAYRFRVRALNGGGHASEPSQLCQVSTTTLTATFSPKKVAEQFTVDCDGANRARSCRAFGSAHRVVRRLGA
ncbi:hypothetical protein M885DRAFT_289793 [Pelagophyceae sp. CCMP2097]|nr:hypothetical protein M885DRAFT_289793 [Pelagophyceae sp. CCMP2097]